MKLNFVKFTYTNNCPIYIAVDQFDKVTSSPYAPNGAFISRFKEVGGSGASVLESQESVKATLAGKRGRTIEVTDLRGNKIEVPVTSTFSVIGQPGGGCLIDQSQFQVYVKESPETVVGMMS